MKHKNFITALLFILLFPVLSTTASANSSWVWLTGDPRPMLPWAIIGTLITEIFIIGYFNSIRNKNIIKLAAFVILGNVVSFLVPYIFIGLLPSVHVDIDNFFERIDYFTTIGPFYIVGIALLILTLLIEIPIVYFSNIKVVESKKRFIISIIVANIITTTAVAIIERTLYKGNW